MMVYKYNIILIYCTYNYLKKLKIKYLMLLNISINNN